MEDNKKEFIEYLAKHLVDHPDEVKVTQTESDKTTIIELTVAKGDEGQVIGRGGQTVNAMRILLTNISAKQGGKRAILELND